MAHTQSQWTMDGMIGPFCVLPIQNGQLQTPAWDYSSGKPEGLQQTTISVSDGAWQTFDNKVSATVATMGHERLPFYVMLSVVAACILSAIVLAVSESPSPPECEYAYSSSSYSECPESVAWLPLPLGIPLAIVAFYGVKLYTVKRNLQADVELRSASQQLATETGLHVVYRSDNTGVLSLNLLKESAASWVFRGFVVTPSATFDASPVYGHRLVAQQESRQMVEGRMQAMQQMGMQVGMPDQAQAMMAMMAQAQAAPGATPAGVGPGTVLQLGQTTPQGLGPGQAFPSQSPPAQHVVQVQVVEAQVVGAPGV